MATQTPTSRSRTRNANSVSVLLGGAGASFSGPTFVPAGGFPQSVAVADFNGDADPDLAVANSGPDNVSILLGGPGASFGAQTTFAAGTGPASVAIADFNGDADPDLAVANSGSNNVSILLGGAGGSFGAATSFPAGTEPFSVATGDFNADSDPDLAVASLNAPSVSILLGVAGGSFVPQTTFPAGGSSASVAVADFNADAAPDLAVGDRIGASVAVLPGLAGGSFGLQAAFSVTDSPSSVAVGDFNADGEPDLVLAHEFLNNVSVLLNTGKSAAGLAPSSLAFGGQTMFTSSPTRDVVVTNTGDAHLRIAEARVRGGSGNRFPIDRENCAGESLLVGESCGVSVAFNPNQPGPVSATLRITDNAPGSPHDVPLSGTGVAPTCNGLEATIVGSPGPDTLTGTPGPDVVALLGGDDSLLAGAGNDTVCGASGDDEINAQGWQRLDPRRLGDDQLRGDTNNDSLYGQSGDDELFGGSAPPTSATAARTATAPTPVRDRGGGALMRAGPLIAAVLVALGAAALVGLWGPRRRSRSATRRTCRWETILCSSPPAISAGIPSPTSRSPTRSATRSACSRLEGSSFIPQVAYAAADDPYSITSADFNADARPDLAVANVNTDNVSILVGTGGGVFAAPSNVTVGDVPVSVATADFNGDSATPTSQSPTATPATSRSWSADQG